MTAALALATFAALCLAGCGNFHKETITCYASDGKVIYKAENVMTSRAANGTGWDIYHKDGRQEWVSGSCVVTVPLEQAQPEKPK